MLNVRKTVSAMLSHTGFADTEWSISDAPETTQCH